MRIGLGMGMSAMRRVVGGSGAPADTVNRVGSLLRSGTSTPPTVVGALAPVGAQKDMLLTFIINTATQVPTLPAGTTQIGTFTAFSTTILVGARWITADGELHGTPTNASRVACALYRFSNAPTDVLDAIPIFSGADRVAFINTTSGGSATGNATTGLPALAGTDYPWSGLPGPFSAEDMIVGAGVMAADQTIPGHAAFTTTNPATSGSIRAIIGDVKGITSLATSIPTVLAAAGGKMTAMLRLVA